MRDNLLTLCFAIKLHKITKTYYEDNGHQLNATVVPSFKYFCACGYVVISVLSVQDCMSESGRPNFSMADAIFFREQGR